MSNLTDHVVFNDEKLAKKYRSGPMPMSALYEAYFDGDLDIRGDIFDLLRNRSAFVKYTITRQHLQWAVTNFVPDIVAHTRAQDEKLVRDLYDRGNDFFESFLGPSMVYTTGMYETEETSLEHAHSVQSDTVARKLQLTSTDRLLDIGCGWGTLLGDLSERTGADCTGITLAQRQAEYGNRMLQERNLQQRARILCQDYRDIDTSTKYDKVTCLEMIEHVGFKNLGSFCELLGDVMTDDGLFLLQWTGLRRALKPEDLIWGLFMNKYVFPGADAALPPSSMLKAFEKAGFEMHSIENVSGHYAHTLRAWHRNWTANKKAVVANYGDRLFRIWNFFLAWSVLIAEQGNAGCYQAVLNKNVEQFNRRRWLNPQRDSAAGEVVDTAAQSHAAPIALRSKRQATGA
jgi:sphingolipid C9-methyltransferase